MSKVYVTQETNADYEPAAQWGDVVFLSVDGRDDFNNSSGSENNKLVMGELRDRLSEYDQMNDYLVITGGSPYVAAAVVAILGARGVSKFNFLRWDNRDRKYRKLSLCVN